MFDLDAFLNRLVDRLPARLRPYAKALVPTALATAAAAADLAVSGAELRQLIVLGGGAVISLAVKRVPNKG